jgi:hypothetical protein
LEGDDSRHRHCGAYLKIKMGVPQLSSCQASIFSIVHAVLLHLSASVQLTSANSSLSNALHWFIYASLSFDLGATASSVFSLVMLSDLASYARQTAIQDPDSLPAKVLRGEHVQESLFIGDGEVVLLRGFGLGRIWELARSHMMICFIMGMLSSFVEVALWAWSLEIIPVSIAVVVPLGVIVLPPFLVFVYLFVGK